MTRFMAIVAALALAGVASAQIRWLTEPQAAVREAKASGKPLMVYVLASTKDRDKDIERQQQRALGDPRVVRLAQRFIPLKLSRSQHRDVLSQFKLSENANLEMSFVSPDGDELGRIGGSGIDKPESLLQKMQLVLTEHARQWYAKDIQPLLTNPETNVADVRRALKAIAAERIADGGTEVIALLEREGLDATTRQEAYNTLAALGTEPAVRKLLELARAGDAAAVKALESCPPPAARVLLDELKNNTQSFDYVAYRAITKICKISNVKPEKFFETAQPQSVQQEIERLDKAVEQVARRWEEPHGG